MDAVRIFWDPQGITLNEVGDNSAISYAGEPHDGDTPYVKFPVRMLGIDTPETSYPGVGASSKSNDKLKELADLLATEKYNVNKKLVEFLLPKLATGQAGTLQQAQGEKAKTFFNERLNVRLTKPGGKKRNLFLHTSKEPFDAYGRILAYVAPKFSKTELVGLPYRERYTFNYDMVEAGWAAPLLIYPNLPNNRDLNLVHSAAKTAFEEKKGIWADPLSLTGYEWRMCIKLHESIKKLKKGEFYIKEDAWIQRFCMDMSTLIIYYPQDYYKVAPYNRIFIWGVDVKSAVSDLNLMAEAK